MVVPKPAPRVAAAAPSLQLEEVGRRFGSRWALRAVTLHIEPGARLLVEGANGSGKSTLLRIISGALAASSGAIALGAERAAESAAQRARRRALCALLPQSGGYLASFTALENLALSARFLGEPCSPRALLPLLERAGLAPFASAPIHTFSSGMRKRLALAQLWLRRPAVALLDEPDDALDRAGLALLAESLEELARAGATVLVTSHRGEWARRWCGRALSLSNGRIVSARSCGSARDDSSAGGC